MGRGIARHKRWLWWGCLVLGLLAALILGGRWMSTGGAGPFRHPQPDLDEAELLQISRRYALTGDVAWAYSQLDLAHWQKATLLATLRELILKYAGREEAVYLEVLLAAVTNPIPEMPLSPWYKDLPAKLAVLILLPPMLVVGGAVGFRSAYRSRPGLRQWFPAKGLYRFFSVRHNVVALSLIGICVLIASCASWLAPPVNPLFPSPVRIVVAGDTLAAQTRSRQLPLPPAPGVPLGTVPGGFDVFYSLIWGFRFAVSFGLSVALLAACLGTMIGVFSIVLGGAAAWGIRRVTDAFLMVPLLAGIWLFKQVMWGKATVFSPMMIALIAFSWMPYTRVAGAGMAQLQQAEYALAARTVGASRMRVVFRHLLPNALPPIIVLLARDIGNLVVLEATLTFIGIGGDGPWGLLLASGRDWIVGLGGNPFLHWWVFLPITLSMILFCVGWNLLGDGLNIALNPHATASLHGKGKEGTRRTGEEG